MDEGISSKGKNTLKELGVSYTQNFEEAITGFIYLRSCKKKKPHVYFSDLLNPHSLVSLHVKDEYSLVL